MVSCSVKMCKNSCLSASKKKNCISYHVFPKDEIRREKWINAIGRLFWTPTNRSVICSDHFSPDAFFTTEKGLRRLHPDSIPSLCLPSTQDSDSENEDGRAAASTSATEADSNFKEIKLEDTAQKVPERTQLQIQIFHFRSLADIRAKKVKGLMQTNRRQKDRITKLKTIFRSLQGNEGIKDKVTLDKIKVKKTREPIEVLCDPLSLSDQECG